MELVYQPMQEWPPLTWVAECPKVGGLAAPRPVRVWHGELVETGPDWFGECIWDGPFPDADFDRTEAVFGSGARVRGRVMTFVSSASMVDRLQYLELGSRLLVSNSLAALVSISGARVAPLYPRYYQDFDTVNRGYRLYKDELATTGGAVRILYHRNLTWDGNAVQRVEKPDRGPCFATYGDYRNFLETAVAALVSNARHPARKRPFAVTSTLSNGYDSTATSALLAPHRPEGALAVEETDSRSLANLRAVSRALGIELRVVDRYDALADPMRVVSFLASGGFGYEMQFGAFEDQLGGRAVFTGYYGDVVWERVSSIPARPDLSRIAQSGLSLTEYRLTAGFIHCPLPFLGARRISSLKAISEQEEMRPWILGRSGYDRPIARRIAEEAGVPREAFGYRKMVGSLAARTRTGSGSPVSADFLAWLEDASSARLLSPVKLGRLVAGTRGLVGEMSRGLIEVWSRIPLENRTLERFLGALRVYGREDYLFKYTFPWALERHMERCGLDSPRFVTGARTDVVSVGPTPHARRTSHLPRDAVGRRRVAS